MLYYYGGHDYHYRGHGAYTPADRAAGRGCGPSGNGAGCRPRCWPRAAGSAAACSTRSSAAARRRRCWCWTASPRRWARRWPGCWTTSGGGRVVLLPREEQSVARAAAGWERRIVSPALPGIEFEFMRTTLGPGVDAGAFDPHAPGSREYVAVESGDLELTIDGQPYQLRAGDAIYYEGDCLHGFAQPAGQPVRVLPGHGPARGLWRRSWLTHCQVAGAGRGRLPGRRAPRRRPGRRPPGRAERPSGARPGAGARRRALAAAGLARRRRRAGRRCWPSWTGTCCAIRSATGTRGSTPGSTRRRTAPGCWPTCWPAR